MVEKEMLTEQYMYIYLDSKILATLYIWYVHLISLFLVWAEIKCTVHDP